MTRTNKIIQLDPIIYAEKLPFGDGFKREKKSFLTKELWKSIGPNRGCSTTLRDKVSQVWKLGCRLVFWEINFFVCESHIQETLTSGPSQEYFRGSLCGMNEFFYQTERQLKINVNFRQRIWLVQEDYFTKGIILRRLRR